MAIVKAREVYAGCSECEDGEGRNVLTLSTKEKEVQNEVDKSLFSPYHTSNIKMFLLVLPTLDMLQLPLN
ncbi:hypothetical protein POVCU2_0010500 [Plasmodium ovale curtisi]|uniref:Uncharacterized protein n=1 Tax=Plasmodium ovale curtisi TaxID=864141 RepID=A0A1A8VTL9_PLAOA|nr:hypothetical protein POVCU2_0010500 [Plasmodium ovale curtisi]SBS83880.1 hypothetical protein POVCU1_009470 [Plasmodium ovale curtisi]